MAATFLIVMQHAVICHGPYRLSAINERQGNQPPTGQTQSAHIPGRADNSPQRAGALDRPLREVLIARVVFNYSVTYVKLTVTCSSPE